LLGKQGHVVSNTMIFQDNRSSILLEEIGKSS